MFGDATGSQSSARTTNCSLLTEFTVAINHRRPNQTFSIFLSFLPRQPRADLWNNSIRPNVQTRFWYSTRNGLRRGKNYLVGGLYYKIGVYLAHEEILAFLQMIYRWGKRKPSATYSCIGGNWTSFSADFFRKLGNYWLLDGIWENYHLQRALRDTLSMHHIFWPVFRVGCWFIRDLFETRLWYSTLTLHDTRNIIYSAFPARKSGCIESIVCFLDVSGPLEYEKVDLAFPSIRLSVVCVSFY